MTNEKKRYGYGPKNALVMDSVEDALIRFQLARTVDPEVTRGMLLPHTYNKEGWWFEVPNLPDNQYFLPIINNLIIEAEKTVHRDVMAKNVITRFVPDIFLKDPSGKRIVEASGQTLNVSFPESGIPERTLIEISLAELKRRSSEHKKHWIYFASMTFLHEIFEFDYNVRMRLGQIPHAPKISEFDPLYTDAPHEQYANKRAKNLIMEVMRDAPSDFRQKIYGFAGEKEIKIQTTAMNQVAAAILRFLAEKDKK